MATWYKERTEVTTRTFAWDSAEEWQALIDAVDNRTGEFENIQSLAPLGILLDASKGSSSGSVTLPWQFVNEGKFFRNGIGKLSFICGIVEGDSRLYKQGARFVDQNGSYYTIDGSVNSTWWNCLNLVEEVDPTDVTDAEMQMINVAIDRLYKKQVDGIKLFNALRDLGLVASGACIMVGVANLISGIGNPVLGVINLGVGIGGAIGYGRTEVKVVPA